MKRVLFCLLACLMLCACAQKQMQLDANKALLQSELNPNQIRMEYRPFESHAEIWDTQKAPNETRVLTDSGEIETLGRELMKNLGNMTTPRLDCADYCAYQLVLKTVQGQSVIVLHFLEKDGKFLPAIYGRFSKNYVWYEFKNPERFIETYWAKAVPEE